MRAVQFGAGKIGRGFLGQLLSEGGYAVTFVDVLPDLVAALRRRGAYPLRLVSAGAGETLTVPVAGALDARREATRVARAVAAADLVGTSVGVAHLPAVAASLAAGIRARAVAGGGPLDVLLCENQWHAAPLMRGLIAAHLPPPVLNYFDTHIGLVETVIGRIVPAPSPESLAEDPLLIVAEPYKELPVARTMLRGPVPPLPGLIAADDFDAYEARKLYLSNAGHAALAYLGWRRGYKDIWECAADPELTRVCAAALAESAQALSAEYGFDPDALRAFSDDLMGRYANRALPDTVARVAADPRRKLRPTDRLVGAADLCLKHGIAPQALAEVIAAALAYDDPADFSAMELQNMRKEIGDAVTLKALCDIRPGSRLGTDRAAPVKSDYVDNWDVLPGAVQEALGPIIAEFDAGADLLFDRRLNLSFEAAVKELSIPGIVHLTDGLRKLGGLLTARVTVADAAQGDLLFDGTAALTAYDLPLYTPCVYLSQLAQFMDGRNVRVWKDSTAAEIVQILLAMARYIRPDIEIARVAIAALHDMAYLYPDTRRLLEERQADATAQHSVQTALRLLGRRSSGQT